MAAIRRKPGRRPTRCWCRTARGSTPRSPRARRKSWCSAPRPRRSRARTPTARSPRASRASRRSARRRSRRASRCAATSRSASAARTKGEVKPEAVVRVARELDAMGCYEITIADTIGTGTPGKTRAVFEAVDEAHSRQAPRRSFPRHLRPGASPTSTRRSNAASPTFDSSVAGLGGCPYAKGATGNVATEDVLYMLDGLGIETGVDIGQAHRRGRLHLRRARPPHPLARRRARSPRRRRPHKRTRRTRRPRPRAIPTVSSARERTTFVARVERS